MHLSLFFVEVRGGGEVGGGIPMGNPKILKKKSRNMSMGHGCLRYCQICRGLSLTKGNNS